MAFHLRQAFRLVAAICLVACGVTATSVEPAVDPQESAPIEPLLIDPQPPAQANATVVAISPDGQLVAAGFGGAYAKKPEDRLGGIVIWDAATGERRHLIREIGDIVRLAFTRDGKWLCYARIFMAGDSVDLDVVTAINVANGEVKFVQDRSGQFAIAAAADRIVAGTYGAELFDATDFRLLRKMKPPPSGTRRQLTRCYALSPNGRWLLEDRGNLTLFDTESGDEVRTSANMQEPIPYCYAATFSPDGRTLATGGRDGLVRLYDVENLTEIGRLNCGGEINVYPLFSPDGRALAIGTQPAKSFRWTRNRNSPRGYDVETYQIGEECQLVFFDTQTRHQTARWRFPDGVFQTYNAHSSSTKTGRPDGAYPEYNPQRFAYSADGKQLLVGCSGVTLLDAASGRVVRRFEK